jgi:hypothetical protein
MRDKKKYGYPYFAELFTVDMESYVYVYSVGIDLVTNTYMTKYSKCISKSFVTYNEDTYKRIDNKKYRDLLEQAFFNNNVTEELFNDLIKKNEPDLKSVKNLAECYEKIAEQAIYERKRRICIPVNIKIGSQHVYKNYNNFCDKNDFTILYLNRYSQNQGWCVRLVQNIAGYKLSVVYHANPLPDLYEENDYMKFLAKYNSEMDLYSECDIYEKEINEWEKKYLIHVLEQENFYKLLAPNMKVDNAKSVGYTGSCEIRIKYGMNSFQTENEKEIYGHTENDDKEACGIDIYGFIQKCLNMAKQQSEIVSTQE